MQVIKPDVLIWSEAVQHYQKQFLKVITGSVAFKLSAPNDFLTEHEFNQLWQEIAPDQTLDDHFPKTLSEVLVLGSFIATPQLDPFQALVHIKVADIDKTLQIFPERYWYPAPKLNEFWPHAPMPQLKDVAINWANAYGGEGYAFNPSGRGFVKQRSLLYDEATRVSLPLVEDPRYLLKEAFTDKAEIMPASFAPLPMLHPLRWRYANQLKLDQLPKINDEVDALFFQQALTDQMQKAAFKPDAAFSISGMNEQGAICGQLPNQVVRMFVQDKNVGFKELDAVCDTLWFLPNHDVGVMTFRGIDAVEGWNANDHEALMLALDQADDLKPLQFFSDTFIKMNGADAHLYRSSGEGLRPLQSGPSAMMAAAEKTKALQKQMQERTKKLLQKSNKPNLKILASPQIKNEIENSALIKDKIFANYDLSGMNFAGKTFENINFSGADLTDVDFSESIFKKVNFVGANLQGARFNQASLDQVAFTDNDLKAAQFSFAYFVDCNFNKSNFVDVNLNHAAFSNCQFFQNTWQQVKAKNCLLSQCLFNENKWQSVMLCYAELNGVRVNNQLFSQVDFSHSRSERSGFVGKKTKFDQCLWQNSQWQDSNFLEASFADCDFENCIFDKSEWMSAKFNKVNFTDSNLSGNAFNDAVLGQGKFEHCNLARSNWQGAQLKDVAMERCFLFGVSLERTVKNTV